MAAASGKTPWRKSELEEDTVEYFLFPALKKVEEKKDAVDLLKQARMSYMTVLKSYIEPYIWQNEFFALQVPSEAGFTLLSRNDSIEQAVEKDCDSDCLPPFLWGRTCYGDCADDEWFIVFLLTKLTEMVPGLVARIVDADGEFLLIEAADHVPDNYEPDTAERRVYICDGHVHLLPLSWPHQLTLADGAPVTMAAVDAVRDGGAATRADAEVDGAVQRRIDGYPGKITESHHRATVRAPAAAAAVLEACPQLLPAAVQAFYLRDPIDLKACRSMRFFPPETCVLTSITFTKTLYAQLVHQRYRPDARTGWQLPPSGDPQHRAADVGMKLACGLEILASRSRPAQDPTAVDPSLDELGQDVRWQRYLTSLKNKQFFGDELEGSQQYTALMEKARQYYVGHMLTEDRSSAPGDAVHQLLAKLKIDHAQWKRREAQLPPADDDSWLEVGPDQLESLLHAQFQLQQQPADHVAEELRDFLSRLSGLDGVETAAAAAGGAASRKSSRARKTSRKLSAGAARKISTLSQASNSSAMSSLSQKIDFNADSFTDALRGMLDLGLDEDEWSDDDDSSGMSSYGDEDGSSALDELLDEPQRPMRQLMAEMDDELRDSTLAESFVRATNVVRKESGASDSSAGVLDEEDSFQPVDVDANTVQNLLRSLQGQTGPAGPAQTVLQSLPADRRQQ